MSRGFILASVLFAATNAQTAAEKAAELAGTLDLFSFSNWQVIDSFACLDSVPCVSSVNRDDAISVTFSVEAGKNYFFGAEASVGGYTGVSAVPVPAAVWLFGSGLLGLLGVARSKRA